MKLFCAYAYTGEELEVVTSRMKMVVETLNLAGHSAYCNRFDSIVDELQKNDDIKGIFSLAFKHVAASDAVVAVVASPNKSVGQIMEIGVALSQTKPVYLFEHTSAKNSSYLHKLADKYFVWDTEDDLRKMLSNLSIPVVDLHRNIA